ncbi:MAG: TIGR03943 family protein [Cyanosarcina radialis HA8281-LM2]|jgi:uncharacterized repeat protein (TIGR03943 family)|nr:TIGR03943 family protein [Cyanosarcina radialis HA8281-LM2]
MLDILAIAAWGILFLKYWLTGKLALLIHPNYFGLVVVTGSVLLVMAAIQGIQLVRSRRQRASKKRAIPIDPAEMQHITLFPPGWASALLLITAIVGLIITPQVFASQTAIDRGITESAISTRYQPKSFRSTIPPEARSLIDWVRTLNANPEPDAYTGQKARIQGFVIHAPELSGRYLLLSRFVLTCCAADAYPVGLPVKLDRDRQAYKPDTWLEVEGRMITETLNGKRQLTVEATALKPIPEPKNPYDY